MCVGVDACCCVSITCVCAGERVTCGCIGVCVAGAASINCVNVVYVDLKFGARCILQLMSPSVLLYPVQGRIQGFQRGGCTIRDIHVYIIQSVLA